MMDLVNGQRLYQKNNFMKNFLGVVASTDLLSCSSS